MAKKRSIYRNPTVAQYAPLDTSTVEDRRYQAGGSLGVTGARPGSFGYRPRPKSDVLTDRASSQVQRATTVGVNVAKRGAELASHPKRLPWGWSQPNQAEEAMRRWWGGK